MQVIVYRQDSGVAAVIYPLPAAVEAHGIHAIAQKDVPAWRRYKVIDSADLPADRTQRSNWTVDDDDLTDGVGGESNVFAQEGQS